MYGWICPLGGIGCAITLRVGDRMGITNTNHLNSTTDIDLRIRSACAANGHSVLAPVMARERTNCPPDDSGYQLNYPNGEP